MREQFEKYYKRLKKFAVIKSVAAALAAAFGVFALSAFIFYLLSVSVGLFISIGLFFAAFASAFPLLYFFKFRPSEQETARQLDKLGLDERAVTMLQFGDDDSYIAALQRTDATNKLGEVSRKKLKFSLSVPIIVALAAAVVLTVPTAVASAVTFADAASRPSPGGQTTVPVEPPVDEPDNPTPTEYLRMEYRVMPANTQSGEEPAGAIAYLNADGEPGKVLESDGNGVYFQIVEQGGKTQPVIAVAKDGYGFWRWSDGEDAQSGKTESPIRAAENVPADGNVTAYFLPIKYSEEEGTGAEKPDDNDEDSETIQKPGDGDDNTDVKPDIDPEEGTGGGSSGTDYNSNNVIDGLTDYGEVYEDYYEKLLERIKNDPTLSEEAKKVLLEYFALIDPNKP